MSGIKMLLTAFALTAIANFACWFVCWTKLGHAHAEIRFLRQIAQAQRAKLKAYTDKELEAASMAPLGVNSNTPASELQRKVRP